MIGLGLLLSGAKTLMGKASPTTWLVIALVAILALGAATWRGYAWGHGVAETKGKAALAEAREEFAEFRAKVAEANTSVAQKALTLYEKQADTGRELSASLQTARKTIAAQGRELRRKTDEAARAVAAVDGRCVFGPAWVRWQNQVLLGTPGDGAGGLPGSVGGSAERADVQAGSAGAGVRQGGEVSPEDEAAWLADYGQYCRDLEQTYGGLVTWARSAAALSRAVRDGK